MSPEPPTAADIVDFLGDIIHRRGAESYLGEAVTMAEHMLQAAMLAEQAGAPDELVAAALLHDIGHYTNEFGPDAVALGVDNEHDQAGAQVLQPFFPPVVVACVRLHVAAKRYLCATDHGYLATVSLASLATLKLQGGPMSAAEVRAFEGDPYHLAAVRVRRWDEAAKQPGRATPPFDCYRPLLERVIALHVAAVPLSSRT